MSSFLLDSDVIIWHLRGRSDITKILRGLQKFGVPACSALAVIEVQLGVKKGEEEKTDRFFASLRVLDVDKEIANHAAFLIRKYKARGMKLDLPDAVIASTCILKDLILVTYNTEHYAIPELKFYPLPTK